MLLNGCYNLFNIIEPKGGIILQKKNKVLILFIVAIFLIASLFVLFSERKKIDDIPYTIFLDHLERGMIKEVRINDSAKLRFTLGDGTELITDNPRTENLKEKLLLYGVNVLENDEAVVERGFILLILIGIGAIFYISKNRIPKEAEKEMVNLSKMEDVDYDHNLSFEDVAGNEEAIASLEEMVDFINNPDKYREFGARLPRGVLLYGPPGTGKTLLAKALAGEAKVPIFPVSGSDFVQVYAGLGAGRIRDLFKKAKNVGKSVIFIDEIDSLGKKRKGNQLSGSDEGDRTLNALLAEMSGFKENDGIIVVAATNRIDVLDEALLRPGRFDRQIEVQLPDVNARHKILKLHGEKKPLGKDVDLEKLATETIYFSGAKLENLLNEAAMIAVKSKASEINGEHVNKAYFKVLVGDEKMDRSHFTMEDKEITAFHEAGHALVAKKVSNKIRVTKVSIIPSTNGMGGFSINIPPDKMYQTKNDLLSNIMIALGGRAAEEIIFGVENITTGASSDLEKATEIALAMIGTYGMDSITGLVNYNVIQSLDLNQNENLTKRTKDILDILYRDTIKLLKEYKKELLVLSQTLMDKEVLDEIEIDNIVNKIYV